MIFVEIESAERTRISLKAIHERLNNPIEDFFGNKQVTKSNTYTREMEL